MIGVHGAADPLLVHEAGLGVHPDYVARDCLGHEDLLQRACGEHEHVVFGLQDSFDRELVT